MKTFTNAGQAILKMITQPTVWIALALTPRIKLEYKDNTGKKETLTITTDFSDSPREDQASK